ncbi:MAG: chemotaxis protein CheW [Thermodesulfobacteriota bacterium]|nr:chemotaxis protein CheW [Thermodesulfobacteriota bacterium]
MVSEQGDGAKFRQFVSFRIDGYVMGIDILKVREVNMLLDITPVQHAPEFVRGLINLRGQTVLVFDMGVLMGGSPRILTEDSHNIILKADDVGLLVDHIGEVVAVEEDEIEALPANMDSQTANYADSVVKLEDELMTIVSVEKVLGQSKSKPAKE